MFKISDNVRGFEMQRKTRFEVRSDKRQNAVANNIEARLALMEEFRACEFTFEEAQSTLKKIKRNAEKQWVTR